MDEERTIFPLRTGAQLMTRHINVQPNIINTAASKVRGFSILKVHLRLLFA